MWIASFIQKGNRSFVHQVAVYSRIIFFSTPWQSPPLLSAEGSHLENVCCTEAAQCYFPI